MTATRSQPDANSPVVYLTTDGKGNPVTLQVVSPTTLLPLPANTPNGWLRIDAGSVTAPTFLTVQNVTDLLPALTQFSKFGTIF